MRVAVTGATGNIGTALLAQLRGRHEVVGIARRPPPVGFEPVDGVRWLALDLVAEERVERLAEAFGDVDAVVHLAWGFQPNRDAAYLRRLDVGGTDAVLQAARRCDVPHLVHVSSVGAYSPRTSNDRVDESWPTGGIGRLPYSVHKAAAERLLDDHEQAEGRAPLVTRIRPSLVARHDVGSALARYVLPSLLPARPVGHVPVLPLPPWFWVQLTHSDDIAAGITAAVERRAGGAFNLAAEPVLHRDDLARSMGARPLGVRWSLVRGAAALTWAARLQPLDPGWLDLAAGVPRMCTERAREVLGWAAPAHRRRGPRRDDRRHRPQRRRSHSRAADQEAVGAGRQPRPARSGLSAPVCVSRRGRPRRSESVQVRGQTRVGFKAYHLPDGVGSPPPHPEVTSPLRRHPRKECPMVVLGIVLLILGLIIASLKVLVTIGIILIVVGLVINLVPIGGSRRRIY